MPGKRTVLLSALMALVVCGVRLQAAPFQKGDVFASVNHNTINVYSAAGSLKQTLNTKLPPGEPSTTGSAFDKSGNLYVTTFIQGAVVKFDNQGNLLAPLVSVNELTLTKPESILFDAAGNAYVGDAGKWQIFKFNGTGGLAAKYDVKVGDKGTDWIDLAADQKTMFYTSEDGIIRRYDVSTKTQLPDFASVGGECFALRILPGDNSVLVAHTLDILRLDSTGKVIQKYTAPGETYWFALNLDPDGTSFWSADLKSGNIYKFDIQSGQILQTIATGAAPFDLAGLSIYGEKTASGGGPVLDPTVTVQNAMTTNTQAASCSAVPTAVSAFQPTDATAYLFFGIKGGQKGDVASSQWIDPNGHVYTDGYVGGAWQPLPQAGDYCFRTDYMAIAGKPAANLTGKWTVNVTWNGSPLFTLNFTIGSAASGLNVNIDQADTSKCPTVKLLVTVTDDKGAPVGGLTASNFTLIEDGQPRTITVTGGASATSQSVALVLDVSGSVGPSLGEVQTAAKTLVAQLPAALPLSLFTFSNQPNQLQDFTTNRAPINSAIDSLMAIGETALYDAIASASQALRTRSGRRTMIVETDGVDTISKVSLDSAILQAKDAGVTIFVVGVGTGIDEKALQRIATETGGVYKLAPSAADLIPILQSIGQTIANGQYEITYTSGGGPGNVKLTATSGNATGSTTKTIAGCATGGPTVTDGVVLTIENASGTPGQSIDVPITLKATGPRPASFQLDVSYDSQLVTYNSVRKGDQLTNSGKDVSATASGAKVTIIGSGLNQNVIPDGTVALMNFKLSPSFPANTKTTLACSNPVSVDAASTTLKTTCTPGAITATSGCSCDVNGDGANNVADVQLIINQVLGKVAGGCDLNGDGQLNVLDAQIVINAALGQGCKR